MMKYTVEKAAYLLGVDTDRLRELIDLRLVDTVEEKGESFVTKPEVARLYAFMHHGEGAPPPAIEMFDADEVPSFGEDDPEPGPLPEPRPFREEVEVTDEALLKIYYEMKRVQKRLRALSGKLKRLGARMSRYQAMGQGEAARFWERATELYPDLWGKGSVALVETEDGTVYLRRRERNEKDNYTERLQTLVAEGIEKGHLPPGFLGVFPGGLPGQDEDEEEGGAV